MSDLPKPGKLQVASCFMQKAPESKPVASSNMRATMPAPAKNNIFGAALKAPIEKKSVAELAAMFGKPKDSGPPPVKPKAAGVVKEEAKIAPKKDVGALAAKFGGA